MDQGLAKIGMAPPVVVDQALVSRSVKISELVESRPPRVAGLAESAKRPSRHRCGSPCALIGDTRVLNEAVAVFGNTIIAQPLGPRDNGAPRGGPRQILRFGSTRFPPSLFLAKWGLP